MAAPIKARQNGDEYQYLILWEYLLKMLDSETNIEKIKFECDDIKSFDDIVIEYKENTIFHGEKNIEKEYIQVKYHQYADKAITFSDLINPDFISAKKSFLEKLKGVYEKLGEDYKKNKFTLYNIYKIDISDDLGKCLYKKDNTINFKRLSKNTIKDLCDYLHVSEDVLKNILSQLTFIEGKGIPEIINSLNEKLYKHDLISINDCKLGNPYIELVLNWFHNDKIEVTKSKLIEECCKYDLKRKKFNESFAIKTFESYTDFLKKNNIEILDFSNYFTYGKFIKDLNSWKNIREDLKKWIEKKEIDKEYFIHLECSYGMAFLAGSIFNSKCGIPIYPYQKTEKGMILWKEEKLENTKAKTETLNIEVNEDKNNIQSFDSIAIINITQNIKNEVLEFSKDMNIVYSKLYNFTHENVGKNSISNANECKDICIKIKEKLSSRNSKEKKAKTHLFISAPVALIFYLGKEFLGVGNIVLYEYNHKEFNYTEMLEIP